MRYFLFGGSFYYPSGGLNDLLQAANSTEELFSYMEENNKNFNCRTSGARYDNIDWWHIFDTDKNIVIYQSENCCDWNGNPLLEQLAPSDCCISVHDEKYLTKY